ncbi:Integrase catalytic core [Macrophomina phaseolina MS6]|uniref:Integrase catalytic core n=1 Tax=Macrophomina phaseolina (strain MS6) TaxID=1126212 RepID=K2R888_MACPH|nr:Integrase catalytic core [Macrophomina phaseolina MS6]
MDHGITPETSAPATPEQNGHSERSGGVLLTKARAMRIGANLPERLRPETIRAAAYIHNRTPIKKLVWTTPFEKITGNKPNLSHLKAYGCKAYSLRKDLPRTHKLAERAFIGYLVGYDSTNIFCIWIPSQDKVIRTRDVTFDKTSFYDPTETNIGKILGKEVIETLNAPNLPSIYGLMPQEESESSSHYEGTNDAQATIQSQAEKDSSTRQLPTPSESVEPQIQALVPQEAVEQQEQAQEQTKQRLGPLLPAQYDTPPQPGAAPGNRAPRGADIAADITEEMIIPEKSSRSSRNQNPNYSNDPFKKPRKPRKEAYAATLAQTQVYPKSTFYNAFSAAIHTLRPTTTLHRDNLPPEPKNFEELLNHPFKDEFLTALLEEIKKLEQIQTWK